MGNVLNPNAEFGPWLTAHQWDGAGACTLHRKPTFDESAPSASCQSRFCLPTEEQFAVLKPRSNGVTSHYVYVDNFGKQSLEEQAAMEGLDAVATAFEEKHLKVHETEIQCEKASTLGIELDGRMLETRLGKFVFVESDPPLELPFEGGRMSGLELEIFTRSLHLPGLGEEAVT